MQATFIELPAFGRVRSQYLTDTDYLALQNSLMQHPTAGDVIEGTGGLRKLRHADVRRGKGKRGGLRVIYEATDLSPVQRKALKQMLEIELSHRKSTLE